MMTKMRSMRDAFGESLIDLAKKRSDFVVLDADVAGGTGTQVFREAFPERFIQCGIAEQNMMSVAAGISTVGLIPIVTCYAVFASMRSLDQVRNSIAYPNFNVKIIVSHLGLDVGPDGATHQCIEDLSIIRSIPNLCVIAPADPFELYVSLEKILDHIGPVYLRTGRSPLPNVFDSRVEFELGKGQILRDGKDVTIVAVGVMVSRAVRAAELLLNEGISARVVNMSSIKPIDKDLLIKCAEETNCIVTAEDHNVFGGLGSAVAEVIVQHRPVPMQIVGVQDSFGESGEPEELAVKYNIDSQGIRNAVYYLLR